MNLIKKASEQLNQIIIDAINKGIASGELKEGTLNPFNIEIPADKSHGDFATNAAMTNVKVFGLPPRKIAEIILANANCEGSYIADLSIAGPGFINAKISPKWFGDVLCAVQDEKQDYGRTTDAPKQKIMVELYLQTQQALCTSVMLVAVQSVTVWLACLTGQATTLLVSFT